MNYRKAKKILKNELMNNEVGDKELHFYFSTGEYFLISKKISNIYKYAKALKIYHGRNGVKVRFCGWYEYDIK